MEKNYEKLDEVELGLVKVIGGFHNYEDRHLALKEYIQANYCESCNYTIPMICNILYPIVEKLNSYKWLLHYMKEYEQITNFGNRNHLFYRCEVQPLGLYDIMYHALRTTIMFTKITDFETIGNTRAEFEAIPRFMTSNPEKKAKREDIE